MSNQHLRPDLRVFAWQGVAYQVDKVASLVMLEEHGPVLDVSTYQAQPYSGPGNGIIYRNASRLSSASEWYEMTLKKAAYDYLDALLVANRRIVTDHDNTCVREAIWLEHAVLYVGDMFGNHDTAARAMSDMDVAYARRVRSDIEDRLTGMPGEVAMP